MSDFFLDNFTGSGSLTVPDVGGAYFVDWAPTTPVTLASFVKSGGGLQVPHNVIGADSYVKNAASLVTFPASWTLEASFTVTTFPTASPVEQMWFYIIAAGPIAPVGAMQYDSRLNTITRYAYNDTGTGGGQNTFAPPNTVVVGVPLVLRIERTVAGLEFFADGVSLEAIAMPTPVNTPMQVSIQVYKGDFMGTGAGNAIGQVDYVHGWGTVAPAFWQDFLKSIEVDA